MISFILFRDTTLAVISALLLLIAFPKFDVGIAVWIAMVPWLIALEGKKCKEAFLLSYLVGLIFFGGISYWIWSVREYTVIDFLLLAVYFPHYGSLWGLGIVWLRNRTSLPLILIAPSLFVALEYLRAHFGFLSAPWMLLGHSQYANVPLIQIASITGVYGLSFLIVLVNVAVTHVALALLRRPTTPISQSSVMIPLAVATVLLVVCLGYGHVSLSSQPSTPTFKVAVIQGNIPQETKWHKDATSWVLAKYQSLTYTAAKQDPLLIVWPETAIPGDVKHHPELKGFVEHLAQATKTHLLVGSAENAKFDRHKSRDHSYNSMFLFSPEGSIIAEYRKMVLLPFGEYPPLQGWITWPSTIVSSMGATLPGTEYTIFRVSKTLLGTTICWEALFSEHFREFVNRGARLMIAASNEAWFGDTAAPYQVLAMTVFRAVENRVAVVRAANTGLSSVIDPFGRIISRVRDANDKELFIDGILTTSVPVSMTETFYTRHGDIFAFLTITVSIVMLFWAWLSHLRPAPLWVTRPSS
jgi:apolipoprotein N-acyltransferase